MIKIMKTKMNFQTTMFLISFKVSPCFGHLPTENIVEDNSFGVRAEICQIFSFVKEISLKFSDL